MIDANVPLDALPVSTLRVLLETYKSEMSHLLLTDERTRSERTPWAAAELEVLDRLLSRASLLEFLTCSNSPFFSMAAAYAPVQQKLKYALRIAHTITQPAYSRYIKVVMLLLREIRFVVLLHDAECFSNASPSQGTPVAVPCKGSRSSLVEGDTVGNIARAFLLIGSRRYYNGAQLLAQRAALIKNKNSVFAKALLTAFAELKGSVVTLCNVQLLLHDKQRMAALLKQCAVPLDDTAATLAKLQATSTDALVDCLATAGKRVRLCAEKHEWDARGSDVGRFCTRVEDAIRFACKALSNANGTQHPSQTVQPAMVIKCIAAGSCTNFVEAAVTQFVDVVDQIHTLAPELSAMNSILRLYGVDEADALAHEVDVVDGTFKRLVGDDFEEATLDAEQIGVAQQVLIPHCCASTGCDLATAQAWVMACLRVSLTEMSHVADAAGAAEAPRWTGASDTSSRPPPAYRIARNVQYRWNDAALLRMPRVDGELDGVVYDARTRQVLFVLEAKHNIADLGKAFKQKERLYATLDQAWMVRAQPPPPAPSETTKSVDGAPTEAATPAVPFGEAIQLHFFVSVPVSSVASAEGSGESNANAASDEASSVAEGEDTDGGGADGAVSPTLMSPVRVNAVFFTQDNFTENFGLWHEVAPMPIVGNVQPGAAAAATNLARARRECRWVYLTSLQAKGPEHLHSMAPAPGGEAYLVESTLVSAIGDTLSSAFREFCRSGRLPSPPNTELKSLFISMAESSFFTQCVERRRGDAAVATVPHIQLSLSFPTTPVAGPGDSAVSEASSNPYRHALSLWKNGVLMEDGSFAMRHVTLRNGFLSELKMSERSLLFAMDSVAKRHGKGSKATPSFGAVVKSLTDLYCLRNLVVVTDDSCAANAPS